MTFASVYNINMERKSDRPKFALPQRINRFHPTPLDSSTNSHPESFFCKYASSVYETVPEDGLELSKQPFNCVVEESQVKEYQIGTSAKSSQVTPVHNMKKKPVVNILAYNFTNISSLFDLLERICVKKMRMSIDELDNHRLSVNRKKRKEQQRQSLNIQPVKTPASTSSKSYRPPLDHAYKRKHGVDLIRGWYQFKALMTTSVAFQALKDYRKPVTSYSIPSGSHLQAQHYYEARIEPSVSVAHRTEESLMYTADPFDPQASKHSKSNLSRLLKEDKSLFGGSLLSHNHKDTFTKQSQLDAYKMPPKNTPRQSIKPSVSSPIPPICLKDKLQLDAMASCSDRPLIQEIFHREKDRSFKEKPVIYDIFCRSQPQSCDLFDALVGDFERIFPSILNTRRQESYYKKSDLSALKESSQQQSLHLPLSHKIQRQASQIKDRFASNQLKQDSDRAQSPRQNNFGYFGGTMKKIQAFPGGQRTKILSKHDSQSIIPATLDLRQTKQIGLESVLKPQVGINSAQKQHIRYQQSIVDTYVPQQTQIAQPSTQPQPQKFAFPIKRQQQGRTEGVRVIIPTMPKLSRSKNKSGELRRMSPMAHHHGARPVYHISSQRTSLKTSDAYMNSAKNTKPSSPLTHHYMSPQTQAVVKKVQSPHRVSFKPSQQQPEAYNIYQLNQGVAQRNKKGEKHHVERGRNLGEQYLERGTIRNNPMQRFIQSNQATPLQRSSQEKGITVVSNKKDDSRHKKSMPSPQPFNPAPMASQPPARPMQAHDYMLRDHHAQSGNTSRNSYQLTGSQPQPQPILNPAPVPYLSIPNTERPKTSRSSAERVNMFQRFWGKDSDAARPVPQAQMVRNSSGHIRPKSMNDKILITIRR